MKDTAMQHALLQQTDSILTSASQFPTSLGSSRA